MNALITADRQAVKPFAMTGLEQRYPTASESDVSLRMAALSLGRELAERVHPSGASLPAQLSGLCLE